MNYVSGEESPADLTFPSPPHRPQAIKMRGQARKPCEQPASKASSKGVVNWGLRVWPHLQSVLGGAHRALPVADEARAQAQWARTRL